LPNIGKPVLRGVLQRFARSDIIQRQARSLPMAERVLPIVRLLFACDWAERDEVDEKWLLKNPWAVVSLPQGASFPFDAEEIWLYAQFAEGVGEFQLAVEIRQLRDDGSVKTIQRSAPVEADFAGGNQLTVVDLGIRMTNVPFDEPGLYQFRVMANYAELSGQLAEIRVLDWSGLL
jgi:hypothetical protein